MMIRRIPDDRCVGGERTVLVKHPWIYASGGHGTRRPTGHWATTHPYLSSGTSCTVKSLSIAWDAASSASDTSFLQAIYKVPAAGWLQVFALAGAIEAETCYDSRKTRSESRGDRRDRVVSFGLPMPILKS